MKSIKLFAVVVFLISLFSCKNVDEKEKIKSLEDELLEKKEQIIELNEAIKFMQNFRDSLMIENMELKKKIKTTL